MAHSYPTDERLEIIRVHPDFRQFLIEKCQAATTEDGKAMSLGEFVLMTTAKQLGYEGPPSRPARRPGRTPNQTKKRRKQTQT